MTMADTANFAPTLEAPPADAPIPRARRQWAVALKALRRLLSDKEDTGQVFEIMRALNGDSVQKGYRRLLNTPGGGKLAYERVELAPRLMDDAWLDSFPTGTVGVTVANKAFCVHFRIKVTSPILSA